jgi:hypothetical protein
MLDTKTNSMKSFYCNLDWNVQLLSTAIVHLSPVDLDDVFFDDDELFSPCDVGKLPPSAFFGNNIYTKKLLKFNFRLIFYLLNVG